MKKWWIFGQCEGGIEHAAHLDRKRMELRDAGHVVKLVNSQKVVNGKYVDWFTIKIYCE